MPLDYHKTKPITLGDAGLDERWLQERIVEDPSLLAKIQELIDKQGYAAEYAVSWFMRHHAKALEKIDKGSFASRAGASRDGRSGRAHAVGIRARARPGVAPVGGAAADDVRNTQVDTARLVTVEFDANLRELPWQFRPLETRRKVHPGELVQVRYQAVKPNGDAKTGDQVGCHK